MKCKFCGEEMPERGNFCPICGKDNSFEEPAAEGILEEEVIFPEDTIEIAAPETDIFEDQEQQVEETLTPEVKKMKRTAAISGCVALLAVLALVLFFGIRGTFSPTGEGWNVAGMFDGELFRENDIFKQDSYTMSDNKAKSKANQVVATIGDAKLTNGQLQIYYQMEVIEFLNQYGYYLSYIGMDYTQPLDQQECMLKEGYTWQQYFLECALSSWQQSQVLALEAQENNFQMDSSYQKNLDAVETNMSTAAANNGYESADAFLQAQCGANTSMADYKSYMEVYFNGYLYFTKLAEAIEVPSDEVLADYFQDNRETLEAQGIKQDGSYVVDVRHILVLPEGATLETIRTGTFSDEAWEAARVSAQAILDSWLAGEATEDSFAALANEHSVDPGSNTKGGLYAGVAVGQMVETFEDWCFDTQRKAGDTGLVKSELGYHIMFFSARGEETWLTDTRQAYLSQQEVNILEEALEKYEMKVSYGKIALAHVDMA